MKRALFFSLFCLQLFAKTYVCFPFFNELDILDIQLNELYEHVDHFVIVESCETFMGQKKPFYLEENKERFAPFWDKIIHIKLDESQQSDGPWAREFFQREQILRGLEGCAPDDLIVLCDCDEIMSPAGIREAKKWVNKRTFLVFRQKAYSYYLNTYDEDNWPGPILFHYRLFDHYNLTDLRTMRLAKSDLRSMKLLAARDLCCKVIENGGWHFTSMGGPDAIQKKMRSWSHAIDDNVKAFLMNFDDSFREQLEQLEVVEIDTSFPRYIQDNLELMRERGLIYEETL